MLFTPTTSSCATEHLQLVHSDIGGPLDTPIAGSWYRLRCMDDATRQMYEFTLMYELEALERSKEWMAPNEQE